jgi:hypothetical protein
MIEWPETIHYMDRPGDCSMHVYCVDVIVWDYDWAWDEWVPIVMNTICDLGSAACDPVNDNFVHAGWIYDGAGTTTGSNVNATAESCEPTHARIPGGASIWYSWTCPASGTVVIDTAGSDFDTVLAVYTGSALDALTTVAADDDSGPGFTSQVSFNTVAGATCRIAVDGWYGSRGNITLNWRMLPTITVAASDPTASETGDPGAFTFTRSGSAGSALTAMFTVGGTATPGVDYRQMSGMVTFAAGSTSANLSVDVMDDLEPEPSETVVVTLVAGTAYTAGSPGSATVIILDDDSSCPPGPWVTAKTLGSAMNSLTAWLGLRVRTGASPLTVTDLGRIHLDGNTAAHELRLIHASTKATVAAALWTPAGGVNGTFRYVSLTSPVTLAANTEYYLVSREVSGGDRWCNAATTLSTTAAASLLGTAISADGATWTLGTVAGRAFIPTDFKYHLCPAGAGLASPHADSIAAGTANSQTPAYPLILRVHMAANGDPAASLMVGTLVAPADGAFRLESSDDLVHWAPALDQSYAVGEFDVLLPNPISTARFFRLHNLAPLTSADALAPSDTPTPSHSAE